MNPSKKHKEPSAHQAQDQTQEISSSIWSSLNRLRTTNWEGAAESQGQLTPLSLGGRKVSRVVPTVDRLDNGSRKHRGKQNGPIDDPLPVPLARVKEHLHARGDQNPVIEESSKRVDFSRSHQLREINWDGTYQDRFTFPTNSEASDNIPNLITTSRDNTHFTNIAHIPDSTATTSSLSSYNNAHEFKSPPFTPPPSISNSVADFHLISPPSSPSQPSSSSSTSSVTFTDPPHDVRWPGLGKKSSKPPLSYSGKPSSGKTGRFKSTTPDFHVSSRIGQPIGNMAEQFSAHRDLPRESPRRQIEEKWTPQGRALDKPGSDIGHPRNIPHKGVSGTIESIRSRRNSRASEEVGLNSPKLPAPFKMPITADLKEDRIMLRLKEKLKQQRVLASSSGSCSNESSLSLSSSSWATPQFSSSHSTKLSLPGDIGHPQDKPRKIAASHSSYVYRESPLESATSWKPVSKLGVAKKLGKPVKQPVLQNKKHDLDTARKVIPPPVSPERPKKMTRLIAPGNKKPSKFGVANIISTSSWRAGQDLVMKELGHLSNTKNRSTAQGEGLHAVRKDATQTTPAETDPDKRDSLPPGDEEVGATGGGGSRDDEPDRTITLESRVLSLDARNVLTEISQGTSEDTKHKSPPRPSMKRKAPKSADPEKQQQPSEKTRHYDQESVRKFMVKQKSDRLKKQNEEKIANQKASERKQQIMHDLTERQKQAAKLACAARALEGDRKRKSDGRNRNSGELVKQDQDDNSTLTEDTGESTPRVVAVGTDDRDTGGQRKRPKDNEVDVNTNQHALSAMAASSSATSATSGGTSSSRVKLIELRGQKMNLDVDGILHQFSQVMKQKHSEEPVPAASTTTNERSVGTSFAEFQLQGSGVIAGTRVPADSEIAFSIGTTNSMARTNEERKQAIKATALTLQSRLAEERRKMEGVRDDNQGHHDTSGDFMSRHSRMVGDDRDFAVFTSDLPGSLAPLEASGGHKRLDRAATQIQAAYRGHNVRQALNWELPGGHTFGHKLKAIQQTELKSRPADDDDGDDEDASVLRDSSTFSEITITEEEAPAPLRASRNKGGSHGNRHAEQTEISLPVKALAASYKPTSSYAWAEATADPYSVMSVFSRQSRYLAAGSRLADMPFTATTTTSVLTTAGTSATTPGYGADMSFTFLKPAMASTEPTEYSLPFVARARYTRVESIFSETPVVDEKSESKRESDVSLSESSVGVPLRKSPGRHSAALLSSSEEESSVGSGQVRDLRSLFGSSYKQREDGDVGLGVDGARMSRDDFLILDSQRKSTTPRNSDAQPTAQPRLTASSVSEPRGRREPSGRLSPNSLANKFSANLTYLESMEESLRHVIGMEGTRSVALAQQETVSLAQILKSRQLAQDSLQGRTHKEATDVSWKLDTTRARSGGKSRSTAPVLLENEANLRPEVRSYSLSAASRGAAEDRKSHPGSSPPDRPTSSSTVTPSIAAESSFSRIAREDSVTSVKTDENLRHELSSSSRTDSQTGSIPEEVPEDDEDSYSVSFDESFSEVLPSESHRKAVRKRSEELQSASGQADISSHMTSYGDLSSLFADGNSFNKFTVDMVRQIMKEEEYRAHHQAALLSLREKALKEKAKVELAWLQQLKQKPPNKAADDIFPNIDKRERNIRRHLQEQKAEIRRLQETNKIASRERQMLLLQHEEIAKLKQNTQQTLQKLHGKTPKEGRSNRQTDVHTEDEMDRASDGSEDLKDSKSDSEVYRDTSPSRHHKRVKANAQKQEKYRLDEKYMTAREQKLHERQKHAMELLEWKNSLDAEEKRVFRLEKKAMDAWKGADKKEKNVDDLSVKKSAPKLASASRKDDSHVISDRILSSMRDEMDGTPAEAASRTLKASISEAISTQISGNKTESVIETISNSPAEVTDKFKSPTEKKGNENSPSGMVRGEKTPSGVKRNEGTPLDGKDEVTSPKTSGSEGSVPEEIPTGVTGEKQTADSSDDTLVNSSANDEYMDTFEQEGSSSLANRKKSPVGRLLLQGSSPLPTPWSHRTGSESESEDSISHTETVSDVSDYEVRIRQLSDELRRRRKEIEILKKERSRRQKEKLKAQEEAMQKQLDVYNRYIQQLKVDKDELEHEPQLKKTAVKPQIKQPRVGSHVKSKQARRSEDVSASFEDMREGTDSTQTSPNVDGKEATTSPEDVKGRKRVSLKLADRLLETSPPKTLESKPDRLGFPEPSKAPDGISEKTISSAVDESIEELSYSETDATEKTTSVVLKIQTAIPEKGEATSEILSMDSVNRASDTALNRASDAALNRASDTALNRVSDAALNKASDSVNRASGAALNKASDSVNRASDKVLSTNLPGPSENELSYSMDFSNAQPSLASRSKEKSSVHEGITHEITEDIEEQSSSKIQSIYSPVKSSIKFGQKEDGPALVSTGIQESDSETESRINSYHTSAKSEGSSRPSSERSVGSISYSPRDDDEEDDDVVSYGSDRMPPSRPQSVPRGAASATTEDNISEHISASLPSISEKRQSHSALLSQESRDILDSLLDYKDDDLRDSDVDKTPVPTPREMVSTPIPEGDDESEAPLETAGPLARLCLGDAVLVAGRSLGVLRYKGGVHFSPGVWAGVELSDKEGDSDGLVDGQRYFSCLPGHGVMVSGCDVAAAREAESAEESPRKEEFKIDEIIDEDKTTHSPLAVTQSSHSPTPSPTAVTRPSPAVTHPTPAMTHPSPPPAVTPTSPAVTPPSPLAATHSPPSVTPSPAVTPPSLLAATHSPPAVTHPPSPAVTPPSPAVTPPSPLAATHSPPAVTHPPSPAVTPPPSPAVTPPSPLATTHSPPAVTHPPSPAVTPPHSTPAASPNLGHIVAERTPTVPVRKDLTIIADGIVSHLTASLVEDCIATYQKIFSKRTATTTASPKPTSEITSHSPSDIVATNSPLSEDHPTSKISADKTTDGVMKSMLDEAITDIFKVKINRTASTRIQVPEFLSSSSVDEESVDQSVGSFVDENDVDEKAPDNDSGLSLDAFQRPQSPVPGDSPAAKDRKLLSDDLTELFGEYIDDDLEYEPATPSSKPPPPYPSERTTAPPEEITPLVPRTREEIAPVLARVVEIYWGKRRFGESMDDVSIPPDFLLDDDNEENTDSLTSQSRTSWRRMLFDLAGEIIRDIYKGDDKLDTPVWQKTQHKSQRFFHGAYPPTTIEGLQPVVQAAVFNLLGLNGNRKYNTVNKWNIRKKKDLVDSILAQELGEEEAGWVNYDSDELSLKRTLAESIFDSLVVDTVHTLNGIYQKRQISEM